MMNTQEKMFFKRVALKMNSNPGMTVEAAMHAVCDDDKRLFELYLTAPNKAKTEFEHEFAKSIYDTIRECSACEPR
jgi:hypothetical protein